MIQLHLLAPLLVMNYTFYFCLVLEMCFSSICMQKLDFARDNLFFWYVWPIPKGILSKKPKNLFLFGTFVHIYDSFFTPFFSIFFLVKAKVESHKEQLSKPGPHLFSPHRHLDPHMQSFFQHGEFLFS